jgi:hypothetical protein
MKNKITRESAKTKMWCEVEIRLSDAGELSITGSTGEIMTKAQARREALAFWISFFEDQPSERHNMNDRNNTNFRTARSAARYVLREDGELHGLDAEERNGKVYRTTACGQIVEEIREWFPEIVPLLPYHLNHMQAGCIHQKALGWGHGKTIALSPDTMTVEQGQSLWEEEKARVEPLRRKEVIARAEAIYESSFNQRQFARKHQPGLFGSRDGQLFISNDAVTELQEAARQAHSTSADKDLPSYKKNWILKALIREAEETIPMKEFEGAVYKDCIGAPCPECGYRYGMEWKKHPLPGDVKALARLIISNGLPAKPEKGGFHESVHDVGVKLAEGASEA